MVDTKAMGFTNGWEQEPLWRKSSNERGCAFYVSTQEKLEVFLLFF